VSEQPNWGSPEQGAGRRVLVVEDDEAIAVQLERGLSRAGYEVTRATTAAQALAAEPPDAVILDLGLPDLDGLAVCGQLRARSPVAILVVTAREAEADRVAALDLGADDYLVKPFGFAELLARLRAALRRSLPATGAAEVVRAGELTVDLRARRVLVAGREVPLTGKEFDLIAVLAEDPGRALSRQEIFERAWDAHWYGPTKVLDVHVAALRRKLGRPELIETVYGVGFRLRAGA